MGDRCLDCSGNRANVSQEHDSIRPACNRLLHLNPESRRPAMSQWKLAKSSDVPVKHLPDSRCSPGSDLPIRPRQCKRMHSRGLRSIKFAGSCIYLRSAVASRRFLLSPCRFSDSTEFNVIVYLRTTMSVYPDMHWAQLCPSSAKSTWSPIAA